MGLFSRHSSQEDIFTAEEYIRQDCNETHISALVRHYRISETTASIARQTGVELSDSETAQIVQTIRNEYGLGPIEAHNQPKRGWFW